MMASEHQLVISAADWPILPARKTTMRASVRSRNPWAALERKCSEVPTNCDTSDASDTCVSDDGVSSRSTGEGDDAGYTSDESTSCARHSASLSANAPAFVPCGVSSSNRTTRLDAKAAVFMPSATSLALQASCALESWHFPISMQPPPGLVAEIPIVVQPPPGLRMGLSTKAKVFVSKVDF